VTHHTFTGEVLTEIYLSALVFLSLDTWVSFHLYDYYMKITPTSFVFASIGQSCQCIDMIDSNPNVMLLSNHNPHDRLKKPKDKSKLFGEHYLFLLTYFFHEQINKKCI
jgi:hypothetical protein